jgi:hypothetical protein
MNRLLFGENLKSLRDAKLFPDASVVEPSRPYSLVEESLGKDRVA